MTTTAILTAAGSGSRLGAKLPKALVGIAGVPMVRVAAGNLLRSGTVDELIVTVPAGHMDEFTAALDDLVEPITFVIGGETRQASVAAALALLNPGCTKVLVHDAARPFAPPALVAAVAAAVGGEVQAAIPALPVVDTIKSVAAGRVTASLDRAALVAVQTPQAFARAALEAAYRNAARQNLTATDDAGLVEATGVPVSVIPGDEAAMKITTPTDLAIAANWSPPRD